MRLSAPLIHLRSNFVSPWPYCYASWYGYELAGSTTETGEPYDPEAYTAAHPSLPLDSYARVKSLSTGESIVVRINDRGPDPYAGRCNALASGEGGGHLPLLHGEDDRVAFYVLGKESRPAHLLRAMLEGLTLEIDVALKRAAQAVEVELSSITVFGGGVRNALWRQL
jgi:hypothetical protein